jgi:hypothetical protein
MGLISTILSLFLVYLFFKVYRLQRLIHLLGLPLGFLFLALSQIFLETHLFYESVDSWSSSLMWLRVITQTGGFFLIAFSYYFGGRLQKTAKYDLQTLALTAIISVICIFGLLVTIHPLGLTSIYQVNDYFTLVNLGLLSYMLIRLTIQLISANNKNYSVISSIIAFAVLWIGQFCFLVWDLFEGEAVLLLSQVLRIVGLALFIRIFYLANSGGTAISQRLNEIE